jgi:hypothetical protein
MLQVIEGPKILTGESLSDGVDCTAGQLVRITMPYTWTNAPLTFQFSTDGVFFNDMFGLDGFEVKIDAVTANSGVIIPEFIGRAIAHLKIRSGRRDSPVPQAEDRTFAVTILTDEVAR